MLSALVFFSKPTEDAPQPQVAHTYIPANPSLTVGVWDEEAVKGYVTIPDEATPAFCPTPEAMSEVGRSISTVVANTPLYTVEEYEVLAHLVWAEAGTEGYYAMLYTGSVVINRTGDSHYPDTIKDVVHDHGQYACVDWYMYTVPEDLAYQVAEELLTDGSVLPENVLGQSGFVCYGWKKFTEVGNIKFSYPTTPYY